MPVSLRSILSGGAAILATAALTPAIAREVHVMSIRMPGGGVEQIQYTGNVAPRVFLVPAGRMVALPMMAPDPFATLERISAMMDREAASMQRQVTVMPRSAAFGSPVFGLPPGASGYSFASTLSGNGVCTRSVQITYDGGNAAPKVVSSTSGNCGPAAGSPSGTQGPARVMAPAPLLQSHPGPRTIEAKASRPVPAGGPMRQVAWNR